MPAPFVERLREPPLLGDGAMGTMLYARGVPLDACFDVLNVNEPGIVQGIHAEFLHNEVPGITVPDAVRARMRDAGDRGLREGIETAQALVRQIRGRYAGVYLMPSFGRFEVVAEVLDSLQ